MRFVVLGDLHYARYSTKMARDARDEFFARLFQTVNRLKPDAVFAIGDVTHSSYADELEGLREIALQAGVEHYYMVNGNHDVLRLKPEEVALHNYNPQAGYFAVHFNGHSLSVTESGFETLPFVLLDTAQPEKIADQGGYIGKAQLDWLGGQLRRASTEQPLVVMGHHPLRGLTRLAGLPYCSINNSQEVWDIFSTYSGQAFYFCGHNHNNSQARRANWLAIQTAAPLMSLNFRVVEITSQGLEIRLVEIDGAKRMLGKVGLLLLKFATPHFMN